MVVLVHATLHHQLIKHMHQQMTICGAATLKGGLCTKTPVTQMGHAQYGVQTNAQLLTGFTF